MKTKREELLEKYVEVEDEQVVTYIGDEGTHYEISGFVHVKFKGKTHEIDFSKIINKDIKIK